MKTESPVASRQSAVASRQSNPARLIEEVYLRRARQLARPADARPASTTFPVLVFGLGTERYGIELSALAEVLPFTGCTAVPGASRSLAGVMNVRGDIRAIADLRQLLDLPPAGADVPGYVVMLRQGDAAVGLKVDSLEEIRQIDRAGLVPDGATPNMRGSRFVRALTTDTVILLDADAALSALAQK